jgi:hypothetical protein
MTFRFAWPLMSDPLQDLMPQPTAGETDSRSVAHPGGRAQDVGGAAMDSDSLVARKVLGALAEAQSALQNLWNEVRERPEVTAAVYAIEFRNYSYGQGLEAYVDAELRNGKAICWFLEVVWPDDSWDVQAEVLVNDQFGQLSLHPFPPRSIRSLDELISTLKLETERLAASLRSIDLSGPAWLGEMGK